MIRTEALTLREYQIEALDAIHAAEARGCHRCGIALPTGTGKTVVFAALIGQRGGRVLILVHRDELVEQTISKLLLVGVPSTEIGVVKAERDEHDCRVVVASVQTLSRERRLARLVLDFVLVVIDEAHHATAATYRLILEHVGALAAGGPLLLGFTATWERADGTALGEIFQEIVYERDLLWMIRNQYLSDLKAKQIRLRVDFHKLHTRAGDFIESETEGLLLDADAPAHVVKAYKEHAVGRKAIAFTPTVKVAHMIAEAFVAAGIPAEAVDGETPIHERRAMLRRFKTGETRVIANCGVLTEGFDEPSVDCIIIARPTKSRPLYVQMVGRGTRRYPGKQNCLILDVVGVTTRHDLMTAATLLGLEPEGTIEDSVLQAVAEREAAVPVAVEGDLVVQEISLVAERPLGWVTVTARHFAISLGRRETLHLLQQGETWTVIQEHSDRTRQVVRADLPLDYALGIGEDLARQQAQHLVRRDAGWRSEPASAAQLEQLRRRRIRHMPTITKGEATDLLTAAFARFVR